MAAVVDIFGGRAHSHQDVVLSSYRAFDVAERSTTDPRSGPPRRVTTFSARRSGGLHGNQRHGTGSHNATTRPMRCPRPCPTRRRRSGSIATHATGSFHRRVVGPSSQLLM